MDQPVRKPERAYTAAPLGRLLDNRTGEPIFIVGAGRSGSTVFHRMFCEHPDVAWQSPLCDRFPTHSGWNRALLRVAGWPVVGPALTRYLRPGERYRYWEHLCHGFARPCRDLLASDVSPQQRQAIPRALAQLATGHRRRPLVKITGWPRVGFLGAVCPRAKFIHVYRDGRAVASSLLRVGFWRGWQGPPQWGFGALPTPLQTEWERHDKSFVALAGIQWKLLMTAMDEAAVHIPPGNFLPVRYEDFIQDPVATFRNVVKFCELRWSSGFERAIRTRALHDTRAKWKEHLSAEQQRTLESVLSESLQHYGYPVNN